MIMEIHSSADDYMDWNISKQERVEGWVITCYCACVTNPISASIGFVPYDVLSEVAEVLNINWV